MRITLTVRVLLFAVKSLCLFLATFLVVYGLGAILLTACFGIFTGTPQLLFSRDLSGIPFVLYALGTALRLGIVVSALVWGLATLFAAIGNQLKSFLAWLAFMVVLDVLVGGLSSVPVLVFGASELTGSFRLRSALTTLVFCISPVALLKPNSGCPVQRK